MEHHTPYLDDMYWPILGDAAEALRREPPPLDQWFMEPYLACVADEMGSVWTNRDPYTMMNEPYRHGETPRGVTPWATS